MVRKIDLTRELVKFSKENFIDIIGFADPELGLSKYQAGNHPQTMFPEVKTVIIIGMHLYDPVLDAWSYGEERNIQFSDSVAVNLCNRIKKFLKSKGYESKTISYGPGLFLKEWAALAGLGPIGKNNLLITEEFGSQVRLRAVVTTAPLICGSPVEKSEYCKSCNKCIESCPANALVDSIYSKVKCNNYAVTHLKYLSNNSVIWCNECIEICPIGSSRKKNKNKYDFSSKLLPEN